MLLLGNHAVLDAETPWRDLAQGEQWETDGEDGSESLRVTYGTDMDDFNPVTQVRTPALCMHLL